MFDTLLHKINEIGVIPVIAISDVEKAVPLAAALKAGGVPCMEITFRTKEGEEAIRRVAAADKDILIGAGTVLSIRQVHAARAAGADFIVSPGLNPNVVRYCVESDIPIVPGCATPSEMEGAMEMGLSAVKFFPAEQAGGLAYIKAVAAPYTNLRFMPTGGINAANLGKYAAFSKIIACGGSWFVAKDLIESGNFAEITRLTAEALEIVKQARKGA